MFRSHSLSQTKLGQQEKGNYVKSCLHLEATRNPLLTQTRVDLEYWVIYSLGPKDTAT